jgi:hypothetical protein
MSFVEINFYSDDCKGYSSGGSLGPQMDILCTFLLSDVEQIGMERLRQWALDDAQEHMGGNMASLEKEGDSIYVSGSYVCSETEKREWVELQISHQQYLQILDDWENKVRKAKPKQVIITYENDQFTFETKG